MNCLGKTIKFGQEEWTVLDWTAQGCLLLSNRYADITAWDTSGTHPSWTKSEIHHWLNTAYLSDRFSAAEQACIYAGSDDHWFWKNKQSAVFLLSADEVMRYREILSGAEFDTGTVNDQDSLWWLRDDDPGDERYALLVHGNCRGNDAWPFEQDHKFCPHGIRPAVWLDFSYVEVFFPGWIKMVEGC